MFMFMAIFGVIKCKLISLALVVVTRVCVLGVAGGFGALTVQYNKGLHFNVFWLQKCMELRGSKCNVNYGSMWQKKKAIPFQDFLPVLH